MNRRATIVAELMLKATKYYNLAEGGHAVFIKSRTSDYGVVLFFNQGPDEPRHGISWAPRETILEWNRLFAGKAV